MLACKYATHTADKREFCKKFEFFKLLQFNNSTADKLIGCLSKFTYWELSKTTSSLFLFGKKIWFYRIGCFVIASIECKNRLSFTNVQRTGFWRVGRNFLFGFLASSCWWTKPVKQYKNGSEPSFNEVTSSEKVSPGILRNGTGYRWGWRIFCLRSNSNVRVNFSKKWSM